MFAPFALGLALHAAPLPTAKAAEIELDQRQAEQAVDQKYGNKKPSELTSAERAEKIRDLQKADQTVLDEHGVSAKTWARDQATKTRADGSAHREAVGQLRQQRDAAAAKKPDEGPREVEIQHGVSDENPVLLEDHDGAPIIEKGLPPEALADQAAAEAADATLTKDKAKAEKPAGASKKEKAPSTHKNDKKKKKGRTESSDE